MVILAYAKITRKLGLAKLPSTHYRLVMVILAYAKIRRKGALTENG